MNLKRTAAATVIAFGIGLPAPTTATGLLNAAPPGPPPNCPACEQDANGQWGIPAEKCWAYGRVGGGSPRGGGGVPGYLPPCPGSTPAGPPQS